MVSKVTYTDITNKQTNGESGAALVNDTKRAINEVIDLVGDIDLGGIGGSTLPVFQPRQLGDGVKTTFNTPATGSQGAKAQHFDVYLNYVYQRPELDFSIDGATGDLTFLDNALPYAPNLNDTIDIKYVKPYTFDTSSDTPVEGTGTGVTKSIGDWFGEAGPAKVTATGTTTSRTLAEWASKETLTYNNIAEAKADTALDTGQSVKTLGHYSAGDGGGAEYIVVAGGTGTDDGGSYHDMTNGNQLELIILDELDVRSLGIRADVDMASSIVSANSISERSGVPLVFTEGNYHSTENLEFTEAINWRGVGAVEISIEEDAGTGIIVSGTKKSSISLSSDINIWDSIITVNTTAGVEVGDLIAIKGTEQFYGVSALYMGGDINKGHLCKVIDVVSATQIEVEVAISDSYATGNVSEIEVWTPITGLHLDNITFRKSNISPSASVMTHLYCDSPLVSRCKFTGAKGIGFMFETCYKAVCKDTFGEGAINLYQFRDEGSYGTLYSKVTGRKAGKIIDLSGFSIPCRDARIVDCEDFNSEDSFGLGTGFGSHWGCEGAIWENCTTRDRFRGFSQRGITEKFINCHVFGACAQSAFQIENPKDVLIKSCTYNSQLLPDREGGTDTFKSETYSKISDLPPSFLVVISNDGSNKCSGFTVEGCEAYGITNRFVEFFTASTEYFGFTIKDNDVYVINSGTANDISIMDTTDTTCTVYDFVSENNTLRTNEGQTNVYNLGVSLSTVIRETLGKPSILEAPKTHLINLDTDTAGIIYAGSRGDSIRITAWVADTPGTYADGVLYRDGTFDAAASLNFFAENSFMTGTTGGANTSGKLALSFTGSRVYVQNRLGSTKSIIVEISSPI